jgi:hypothetical protein
MKRMGFVLIVTPLVVASLVSFCDARFYVGKKGSMVWVPPGEGWAVGGFGRWPTEKLPMVMPERPAGQEGLRLIELMVDERGEWLRFGVGFRSVRRVVFTKGAKIVVVDKKGNRYESEGLFFCPDEAQSEVYDTRKMSVVVTMRSVYCRSADTTALGTAKFAEGSVRPKDIVEFDVVGAVGDSTYRDTE